MTEGMIKGPILVVDDERFFQDLLLKILSEEGYDVSVAGSGSEAIRMFGEGSFQVVVLDLVLPDIMGTEVLTRLRELDQDLVAIMITAYASLESAIEALKAGAYDYIRKPIVREDLLRSVERALERQQLAAHNRMLFRQLEARLAEVKALSREKEEVFRILDEGLVVLEENGRIMDLNPMAERILGKGESPLAGVDFHDTGFPLPDGFLPSVAANAGRPVRAMLEITGKGGEHRDIQLVGLSLSPDPSVPKILLGLRDMTEVKNLQRRREEFLAIVTHDLRTPLTSLKGFIELLMEERYEQNTMVMDYLKIIDAETDRMVSLINDILDLDRLDSDSLHLDIRPQVLPELLEYTEKIMEGYGRQRDVNLRSTVRGRAEDLVFLGDRNRFLQVLTNLYSNAIRFSPRGGIVESVAFREAGEVVVEILDEGPGVPPEEMERIFDKYHQVRQPFPERAKGSGLGLTIVKRIVEMHGGRIRMENRGDKQGSRFIIRLPTGDEESG
ncbi:MAG: response regulator [bacterium]|nr:MAG: response regulator [bacterium]